MKVARKLITVTFTTKGQVVIPSGLRRLFEIEDGTRAAVIATQEGILLKPITAVTIRQTRGLLKKKTGDQPFSEEWKEYKRQELMLEERKHGRASN